MKKVPTLIWSKTELIQETLLSYQPLLCAMKLPSGYITLEQHYYLYKTVFLAAVLFNSQSWTNISKMEFNKLRIIQLKFLNRVMKVPKSTPNAFTYMELGVIPIKHEIQKRQLMFLHHILSLPNTDPVSRLYNQQKSFPYEKNWANTSQTLLEIYSLQECNIPEISKHQWKQMITSAVTSDAFNELSKECESKTKTQKLTYETLSAQKYLFLCPTDIASLIFKIRSRTLNCRDNQHSANPDTTCRLCGSEIEDQTHIINCTKVRCDGEIISLKEYDKPNFEINLDLLQTIRSRYQNFLQQVK